MITVEKTLEERLAVIETDVRWMRQTMEGDDRDCLSCKSSLETRINKNSERLSRLLMFAIVLVAVLVTYDVKAGGLLAKAVGL